MNSFNRVQSNSYPFADVELVERHSIVVAIVECERGRRYSNTRKSVSPIVSTG